MASGGGPGCDADESLEQVGVEGVSMASGGGPFCDAEESLEQAWDEGSCYSKWLAGLAAV